MSRYYMLYGIRKRKKYLRKNSRNEGGGGGGLEGPLPIALPLKKSSGLWVGLFFFKSCLLSTLVAFWLFVAPVQSNMAEGLFGIICCLSLLVPTRHYTVW